MIIPTILVAVAFALCEAVYRRSFIAKDRKIKVLESLVNELRNENDELRARIDQYRVGRMFWIFGKGTCSKKEFLNNGPNESLRKILEETMFASILKEYPTFIRDFVVYRYDQISADQFRFSWQFKAQEKVPNKNDYDQANYLQ